MPVQTPNPIAWRREATRWARPLALLLVLAEVFWLLTVSWNRWVDPLIDFGAQLYIPWRITLGEHLGRDFVHPYGPLSSYFNAALFWVFGVSLRTLVLANLVIFSGIFLCLHVLLRRAFGFLAATVALLLGIAVFGFNHYTGIANYTYAAPYSHEATHGLLLLLLLLIRLNMEWPRPPPSGFVAGLLLGLIALTKVEIVFAALAALLFAALTRGAAAGSWRAPARWGVGVLIAAAAVLLTSWSLLAMFTDARHAAVAVGSGTLSPFLYPSYAASGQGRSFLGVDFPLRHLGELAVHGGAALGVIGLLTLTVVGVSRATGGSRRNLGVLFWIAWLGAAAWLSTLPLLTAADAFPLLLGGGAVALGFRELRRPGGRRAMTPRTFAQGLLLVTAVAMMCRMALAPRIFHYGFVQALLAGTWLAAFYVGEWPQFFRISTGSRRMLGATAALLFAAVAVSLLNSSRAYYDARSEPIGVGGDRIVGYSTAQTEGHRYLELARDYIATHTRSTSTLLVAPEGITLNYLTRRKSPLPLTNLLPATLRLSSRPVVEALADHPPDYILLISRMVWDEEIKPFGSDENHGRSILLWMDANYEIEAHIGQFPLQQFTPENAGWILLRRRAPPP